MTCEQAARGPSRRRKIVLRGDDEKKAMSRRARVRVATKIRLRHGRWSEGYVRGAWVYYGLKLAFMAFDVAIWLGRRNGLILDRDQKGILIEGW